MNTFLTGVLACYMLKEIHGEKQNSERLMLKHPSNYNTDDEVLQVSLLNDILLTMKAMIDKLHILISLFGSLQT